jgi:hypothetical protein
MSWLPQANDTDISLEFVKAMRLLHRGKKAFADHEWRFMETFFWGVPTKAEEEKCDWRLRYLD